MKAPPDTHTAPPAAAAEPVQNYAEVLAAFEARRRMKDDLLLRKMVQPLEPMNPAIVKRG